MQKIDLAVWPRAELFRFFSAVSQPFYSVTFRVDVTNLHVTQGPMAFPFTMRWGIW